MTLEILLSSISEQEKNAYLQKTISALSDEEKNLLQTYFEANMSLLGTSQKLFLHKNTVQYKLNHIYQAESACFQGCGAFISCLAVVIFLNPRHGFLCTHLPYPCTGLSI